MPRYIGLDAQASSCTLAVLTPSGERVGSQVVETIARGPIETRGQGSGLWGTGRRGIDGRGATWCG
jgi:hypothetical protein